MSKGFFITGTDTGVGKTWFTVLLMQKLQQQGLRVNGMKPIASGAEPRGDGLANEDALAILETGTEKLPYEQVNPFVYEPPVAPHIAAQQANRPIDPESILAVYKQIKQAGDALVVEGVGGWRVPINEKQTLADLVRLLQLPVVLVVGLRLGCISHALLSAEAIRRDGVPLLGWVLSELDPEYMFKQETLQGLESGIAAPLLGELPHCATGRQTEAVLNLTSAGRAVLLG